MKRCHCYRRRSFGLVCAGAGEGRSAIILDHTKRAGSKIRVSGGGRCNFTNLNMSHEHFISRNSHFCKSALARFRPHDFVSLLTQYGIGYYERMRSAFAKELR